MIRSRGRDQEQGTCLRVVEGRDAGHAGRMGPLSEESPIDKESPIDEELSVDKESSVDKELSI